MFSVIGALVVAILIALGVISALDWFRNKADKTPRKKK